VISNLVSRIRAAVTQALPAGDGAVVLAVSGGADSMCLADAALAMRGGKPAFVIAHLNHQLRGEDSEGDAQFVQAFAMQRAVPCVIGHAGVKALSESRKVSIEVAARDARYAFLADVAMKHGATHVALAHHADDQAETVLLRLLRGTGPAGLRGMQLNNPLPNAPHLIAVRPLLHITREQIEQYCRACKLDWRHDASNDTLHHTRNRIRHELLPLLAQYNPNIRATLTRLADTLASDYEIVESTTRETFDRIAIEKNEQVHVDRKAWRALSAGLQRATLREAVRRLKGDVTQLSYAAIEEAREVLNSDAGVGEIALMTDVRIEVAWKAFVVRLEIGV
jgi:tRNA(Ile)-lysidine synthase